MTNHQSSILCRIFGHSYAKQPNHFSLVPCDRWDNCDIKEHEVNRFHYFCKRCSFEKIVRYDAKGFLIH